MSKKVLCVSKTDMRNVLKLGLDIENILTYSLFIDRKNAENNRNWKQIIPYMVFRKADGTILTYEKSKKSSEKRLHGFLSIGIGGHVNPCDYSVIYGAVREVKEEIGIDLSPQFFLDNLDNYSVIDIKGGVSAYHTGFCFIVDVEWFDPEKIKFSREVESIEWLTIQELNARKDILESWSNYILEMMQK